MENAGVRYCEGCGRARPRYQVACLCEADGSACGEIFRPMDGEALRRCELNRGHEGACQGGILAEVRQRARRQRKAAHARFEEGQRAQREASSSWGAREGLRAALAGKTLQLSPDEFAQAILAALRGDRRRHGPIELLAMIAGPCNLQVNGRPAGRKEVRQMLCRLERDGLVHGFGAEWEAV